MHSEKNNISCVLTTHNKENMIESVVTGLINNFSNLVTQFVIVFDGCSDNTEYLTKNILSKIHNIDIEYVYTDDVFETKANNAGLKKAYNPYALLVQDDMIVCEKNFDNRMLQPFLAFEDVFAVTSQTSHNNLFIDNSINYIDLADRRLGASREFFYVREIANRGPLMYNTEDVRRLDYFDELFCPNSYDDHDISYRAKKLLNKVSGLYWIDYQSEPSWGTGRQKNQHIHEKAHRDNEKKILDRHRDVVTNLNKQNEQRRIK